MRDIHIHLPEELLVEIEEAANEKYMSRAEYIRYVLDKEVGGKYPEAVEEAAKEDIARFANMNDS